MESAAYGNVNIMRTNEDMLELEEDEHDEDQEEESDDDHELPGFRFYPTDEELVDFYLKRKVVNKPFTLDLIKEIDIYKYDPWDLPKWSTVGDNEWYFFSKRGRKYRNSVRPNRVTGSGFWKATGIDKPIRSNNNNNKNKNMIVGLKKCLVYYVGNAGKGTKTDWMMHEFRLPCSQDFITHNSPPTVDTVLNDTDATQEAEVWTVCRIFKRNVPSRKYTSNWREISTKSRHSSTSTGVDVVLGSNSSSTNKSPINKGESFISFGNNDIQNPNYNDLNISSQHVDRTFAPEFPGLEHYSSQHSNHYPLPRTHISTMPHVTPADQAGSCSTSVFPMDISSYEGNSRDQLAGSTQESWDELRKFWSSFQDQ